MYGEGERAEIQAMRTRRAQPRHRQDAQAAPMVFERRTAYAPATLRGRRRRCHMWKRRHAIYNAQTYA